MNHYIYRIQPIRKSMLSAGPTEEEANVVSEHFNYLSELTAQGIVLMAGRTLTTDERTFGIVIFAASSDAEANNRMEADPAIAKGVMRGEVFPFRIALWSPKSWPESM